MKWVAIHILGSRGFKILYRLLFTHYCIIVVYTPHLICSFTFWIHCCGIHLQGFLKNWSNVMPAYSIVSTLISKSSYLYIIESFPFKVDKNNGECFIGFCSRVRLHLEGFLRSHRVAKCVSLSSIHSISVSKILFKKKLIVDDI